MTVNPKLSVDQNDVGTVLRDMVSAEDGIVAFAGGGQANATELVSTFNAVATVATNGDSVKLPPALPGCMVIVKDLGAANLNIFPQTGESINALAANAAYSLTSALCVIFVCATEGLWATVS